MVPRRKDYYRDVRQPDRYQYGEQTDVTNKSRLLQWQTVAEIYNKRHPEEPIKMTKQNAHRICIAALKKLKKAFLTGELEAS